MDIQDLLKAKSQIEAEIQTKILSSKLQDIKEKGYCIIVHPSSELEHTQKAYLHIILTRVEGSWFIDTLNQKQMIWMSKMKFEYVPALSDIMVLTDHKYDGSTNIRGMVIATLFYIKCPCPEGKFEVLDIQNEEICKGLVQDDKIYINDKYIGNGSEWSKFRFVLLP